MLNALCLSYFRRKYTPIDPEKVPSGCKKAFVNVFAESSEEDMAIVCCGPDEVVESPMCHPKS